MLLKAASEKKKKKEEKLTLVKRYEKKNHPVIFFFFLSCFFRSFGIHTLNKIASDDYKHDDECLSCFEVREFFFFFFSENFPQ